MTEEIINSDGSRNWQANILLDNITRLEQEDKELKEKFEIDKNQINYFIEENENNKLRSALEEIRVELCKGRTFYEGYFDSENLSMIDKVIKKINEVLE